MSLTSISDTLLNADQSLFTGELYIYRMACATPIDCVHVSAGVMSFKLAPGHYVILGLAAGQTRGFYENWTVTATSTTLASLRAVVQSASLSGPVLIATNSAPADASISANQAVLWFDPTNAAGVLNIKGKTADGTVVSGIVALA